MVTAVAVRTTLIRCRPDAEEQTDSGNPVDGDHQVDDGQPS